MNRKMFFLILIVGFIVLLAGCAPTVQPQPQPQPPTPTTCTVIVTSQNDNVWGQAVYMDGTQMPNTILPPWGSVQIDNVTVGVRHAFQIIQGNTFSRTIYHTTVPGVNYIDFYQF